MAYKQNPGRGNQPKTGRGIPAPFKQTMGAVGAGAGTATGNYITKKVKEAGKAVSSANKAGMKAFDEGISADNFATGSGAMRSYKKDGLDYVKGFVKDITSDKNVKTNQKKKSPVKQMETIKKVYNKGKELVSKVGNKIYDGAKYFSEVAEGRHGSANYNESDEDMRIKNLPSMKNQKTTEVKKEVKKQSPMKQGLIMATEAEKSKFKKYEGSDKQKAVKKEVKKQSPMKQGLNFATKEDMAKSGLKPYKGSDRQKANQKAIESKGTSRGSVQASKNPKSESNTIGGRSLERNGIRGDLQKTYKGSPTKQLGRQAVTKMGGKKAPAKMKKC